ncbi:MAG TPA: choline-sulfatase [Streptosporangiaceae bacterium]|nr:choline-sulfatase [Streptosporangiaceae bacterium]
MPSQPNILLIMADQLAAGWLPVYGHRVVHAPNVTALAAAGTTFESAYCASPLCAPSRASMLTGLLPSRTGVYDNAAELPASVPTLAHHLRAAGYHTTLAGKMHFVGPDQLHGFEERLTADIYPAGLDWTPDWRKPLTERLSWYHSMDSVLTPGVCEASMQTDYDDEVAFHAARALYDHARYHRGQPFLLVASFTDPHDPWEIARRYWDRYDPAAIALPAVGAQPLDETDPYSRRLRQMCGADEGTVDDATIRTARHAYYAAISYVDERIGQILTALHGAGLAGDTIVIFTADHGEMLGERGLWYKMSFFEPSARVPLIFTLPRAPGGRRVAEPVSLLDLAPTLTALAGTGTGTGLNGAAPGAGPGDGVCLLPWLSGGRPWQRPGPVVAEYLAEAGADSPDQAGADSPDQAGAAHRDLRAYLAAHWDLPGLRERVLASQRDRRLVGRALNQGTYTSWDYQPSVNDALRYVRSRADLYELQKNARLDPPHLRAPPRQPHKPPVPRAGNDNRFTLMSWERQQIHIVVVEVRCPGWGSRLVSDGAQPAGGYRERRRPSAPNLRRPAPARSPDGGKGRPTSRPGLDGLIVRPPPRSLGDPRPGRGRRS